MSKTQWKNLWHSFRWMRRLSTEAESIAWCAFYNDRNGNALRRVLRSM